MEIKVQNYNNENHNINFTINHNEINGIIGNTKNSIVNIIRQLNYNNGEFLVDGIKVNKDNIQTIKGKISYIKEEIDRYFYPYTVYERMIYEIKTKNIVLKNPDKKIRDSLRIVDLDTNLLTRQINDLSHSEKKIIQLAIALLNNPDLIIIEEPFSFLDKENENKRRVLLQKIKDLYDKTIIFVSKDTEKIYKYTTHLIISNNKDISVEGNTKEEMEKVATLKKLKIEIPEIIAFTYQAKKKKKVKIDYHRDVRDIIKDIYKHV